MLYLKLKSVKTSPSQGEGDIQGRTEDVPKFAWVGRCWCASFVGFVVLVFFLFIFAACFVGGGVCWLVFCGLVCLLQALSFLCCVFYKFGFFFFFSALDSGFCYP